MYNMRKFQIHLLMSFFISLFFSQAVLGEAKRIVIKPGAHDIADGSNPHPPEGLNVTTATDTTCIPGLPIVFPMFFENYGMEYSSSMNNLHYGFNVFDSSLGYAFLDYQVLESGINIPLGSGYGATPMLNMPSGFMTPGNVYLLVFQLIWTDENGKTNVHYYEFPVQFGCVPPSGGSGSGGGSSQKTIASPSSNSNLALNIDTVYPNPFRDNIYITYTLLEDSPTTISVIDALGRTIIQQSYQNQAVGSYQLDMSVPDLPVGMYYLLIETKNTRTSHLINRMP